MDEHEAFELLRGGCEECDLPAETATELIRFLIVKKLAGKAVGDGLSPSAKIDELQHWVLLNTDVRHKVETLVGEIQHSTKTAKLAEAHKAKRR